MPKLAVSPEEDKEEDDLEDTPLGPSDGMKTLNSYLFIFLLFEQVSISTCSTG
jgi:hypothetical protein